MKLDRFINRPVLSTVISVLIVILGIIGLATLPVTQYPDIAPPTVSVRATYTGANSTAVLNSVIAPLEDQINGVENMMYIQSTASNNGAADINVYFNQGTDPDMAAVNVQNRVSMAQGLLPAEVTKVGVTTQKRQNSMLMVFSLYDETDSYNIEFIENYANINLIPEIKRVKGVGDATVLGQDYSMRIWLKPDVMAQYKLIPTDVSAALAEQNIEAAPGQFGERGNQTFQYTIRYKGRLQQTNEFEDIVIKALPDGNVLRLGDVADIELGRLSYTFNNMVNGHKAVSCIVYQMAGTNATETISGSCSPKDFETMMQLTYLTFTSPRKDNEAFESYKNRLKAQLQNADANPMTAFSDTVTRALYGNHPRAIKMRESMVDQIDYDRIIEMYKDRFKDASDFTFYLVGNVNLEQMKPMIAKYLGALPSINRKETFKDNKMDIRKGQYKNEFAKKQETPMATIMFLYSGTCKYDLRNNILLSFLDQALDMVYTAEIREKEGGTYGVNCNGSLSKYPKEELVLQIVFQTDPAKTEKLSAVVVEQLNKMAKEGPSAEHMQKIKEYMLKKYKDAQKENGYWLNNLDEFFYTGIDNTKDYEKLVNSITAKEVQNFLAKLLKQNNEIQVVMTMPEESK